MKKILVSLLVATVGLFAGNYTYIQLSSNIDQTGNTIIAELVDGKSGVGYDKSTGTVKIKSDGLYLVVYAPQTNDTVGCSNYWFSLNDTGIDNSNIKICQTEQGQTTVGISQGLLELKKGDKINFKHSGTLGGEATNPDGEPLVPSVIISLTKIK